MQINVIGKTYWTNKYTIIKPQETRVETKNEKQETIKIVLILLIKMQVEIMKLKIC